MARKSLSRTTAEALGPIVVPIATKVALPLAFDSDRFLAEAKESLAKGVKKSRGDREELKEQLSERGSEIYDEVRKQGADLLESIAERGAAFADEWMGRKPRRRFRLVHALALVGAVGIVFAVIGRK